MKVSLSWLRQYVAVNMPVDELVAALTMAGLEVEASENRYGYLDTVVVGRVVTVAPHPNADRLKVCAVAVGDRKMGVVCGAPNVAPEQNVAMALPGTVLPDGFELKKTTIRGEPSEGMICSEAELGLGTDAAGIMVLPGDLETGMPLATALGLNDWTLDIDLTPNRPDCLSLIGVAREIAAIENSPLKLPDCQLKGDSGDITEQTSVSIQAPDHCPRYAARLVTDITVGPSPFWLQDRLMSVGLRPINNIVDITNFVMMETGQPLHAFDFDRLAENRIVVRTAAQGETFTTLDGKQRQLTSEMLMICDGRAPVGVAGVMGGLNSEIENDSTRVLIESAYFNPVSIRKTAKKLGLNTDASHRFERGVDPAGTIDALNRAAGLMAELGGGRVIKGTIDAYPRPVPAVTVALSVQATNRLLGTDFNQDRIGQLLTAIGFSVTADGPDVLHVAVPSFRVDVTRPEDLMEEVARVSGYDHIPTTFPQMPAGARRASKRLETRAQIKRLMTGFGYSEAINYSFIDRAHCDHLRLPADDPRRATIAIMNPLTEDQAVMRTCLVPGLLETMARNLSRQVKDLRLFEIGRIYTADGAQAPAAETEMLAALLTGQRQDPAWHARQEPCDFFDIKGVVEGLLMRLGVGDATFTALAAGACFYTRPGHTAEIVAGQTRLGRVGEVHPALLSHFDLGQSAFVFELDVDRLLGLVPDARRFEAIPKFPAVYRDITLIIDRKIEAQQVLRHVGGQDEALVENLQLFDVYQGDPIPEGRKSISFRVTYRSLEKTLEDEAVNALHETITGRLVEAFDAGLPV